MPSLSIYTATLLKPLAAAISLNRKGAPDFISTSTTPQPLSSKEVKETIIPSRNICRLLPIFDKLIAEVESGEIGYDEALERTGVNRLLIEKRTATI